MNRRNGKPFLFGLLLFCLLSATGCSIGKESDAEPENRVQAEAHGENTALIGEKQSPAAEPQSEARAYYEAVITAAAECMAGKENAALPGYDFSSVISANWDYEVLGYLIEDLDGNGVEELILGGNEASPGAWYESVVYDIYTVSDGELVHVLSGWERNRYYLCENGMIANESEESAFQGSRAYYTFDGAELCFVESVTASLEGQPDGSAIRTFYHSTASPSETENPALITEEQALEIEGKYTYEHPEFTPF